MLPEQIIQKMSLTKRWREHDCLSQIVLAHALRQATVSLSLSVRQKLMRSASSVLIVAICAALSGCTPKEEASFYLSRNIFTEDRGLETPDAIIRSQKFWTNHVATRLTKEIPEEDRLRASLNLSFGDSHDGVFREVVLSLRCSSPEDAAIVSTTIIQGLSDYISETGFGKEAIRLQKNETEPNK